jgi:hypothetical protein
MLRSISWLVNFKRGHIFTMISHSINKNIMFVWLFIAARAIFQLSDRCHHNRWQGCKIWHMLSTYGFYQWRFFYVPQLRHGTSIFKFTSERPGMLTFVNAALLANEQSLPILGLTRPHERGSNSQEAILRQRTLISSILSLLCCTSPTKISKNV